MEISGSGQFDVLGRTIMETVVLLRSLSKYPSSLSPHLKRVLAKADHDKMTHKKINMRPPK